MLRLTKAHLKYVLGNADDGNRLRIKYRLKFSNQLFLGQFDSEFDCNRKGWAAQFTTQP
jgi:hypothetical protein